MLDSAETKTASKISQSKGTFNSTHDEFLNRFPSRNIEEIRDLDKETDIHKRTKNKAENDKTGHAME
ncbi:hypothetical protein Tco_1488041, partial [Tanacetum coccineum]